MLAEALTLAAFPYRAFMRASLPVGAAVTTLLLVLAVARELLAAYAQEPAVQGTPKGQRAHLAAQRAGRYVPPLVAVFSALLLLMMVAILQTG